MHKVKLNDGNEIPSLGLGTYQSRGKVVRQAVEYALEAGYRHIDTAKAYNNEEDIGAAIKSSYVQREEIFITSKLDNDEHGFNEALNALNKTLVRLRVDYLDLYLIHWPSNGKRVETWEAFEEMQQKGLCKSIGVSNFTPRHLQEILDNCDVTPAINQIEFNPFVYQKKIADFCKQENIRLEAYTPLARTQRFDEDDVKYISKKYDKTPAQILLRWSLQHGAVVIPKSTHKERIIENSKIFDFEIDEDDMEILNSKNEDLRVAPDPYGIQ